MLSRRTVLRLAVLATLARPRLAAAQAPSDAEWKKVIEAASAAEGRRGVRGEVRHPL